MCMWKVDELKRYGQDRASQHAADQVTRLVCMGWNQIEATKTHMYFNKRGWICAVNILTSETTFYK